MWIWLESVPFFILLTQKNSMTTTKLLNLQTFSANFPSKKTDNIDRENYIAMISEFFESGIDIVCVEGKEDIGKTTLLAQYCNANPHQSFSYFVPNNELMFADTTTFVIDLCNQLSWFNTQNSELDITPSDSLFKQLLIKAQLKKKQNRTSQFYLVIDGLEDFIVSNNEFVRDILTKYLPPDFKILISGDAERVKSIIGTKTKKIKGIPLTPFTKNEIRAYFSDNNIDDNTIIDLCKITSGGYPGKLFNIKALLKENGVSLESLLLNISKYDNIFIDAWDSINKSDQKLRMLLSLICFYKKEIPIYELEGQFGFRSDEINSYANDLSILCIENEKLSFISNGHLSFFSKKLESEKNKIYDLRIERIEQAGEMSDRMEVLPTLFNQRGRYIETLKVLDTKSIITNLNRIKSINSLNKTIKHGIEAAKHTNSNNELLRMSLHKATLNELTDLDVWESEIDARVRLNNIDGAIELANQSAIKEDRLKQLTYLAKSIKDNGGIVQEELIQLIKASYDDVNLADSSEVAVDIACNLFYSVPSIAIDIISKTTDSEQTINDWMLTKLTIAALDSDKGDDSSGNSNQTQLSKKIDDDNNSRLITALKYLVREFSPKILFSQIEKLNKDTDKVKLLLLWIKGNQKSENLLEVLNVAHRKIINNTSNNPINSILIKDLTIPFVWIEGDNQEISSIVKDIDALDDKLIENGPTNEYIKYNLNIVKWEIKTSFETANKRIKKIIEHISNIPDLQIKLECYAATFDVISSLILIHDKLIVHFSAIKESIRKGAQSLLKETAYHDSALEIITGFVAITNLDLCDEIIKSVNNISRRNFLYFNAVKWHIQKNETEKIAIEKCITLLDKITEEQVLNRLFFTILNLTYHKLSDTDRTKYKLSSLDKLYYRIKSIKSLTSKCIGQIEYCRIAILLKEQKEIEHELKKYIDEAIATWEKIENPWEKINLGFSLVSMLSDYDIVQAQRVWELNTKEREGCLFESENAAVSHLCSVKIIIKLFASVAKKGQDAELYKDELFRLIEKTPSIVVQSKLWSDLSLELYYRNNEKLSKYIYKEKIQKNLEELDKVSDTYGHQDVFLHAAPIIYQYSREAFLDYLKLGSRKVQSIISNKVKHHILYKINPNEGSLDLEKTNSLVTYDDALEICALLNNLKEDNLIFTIVNDLSNRLKSKEALPYEKRRLIYEKLKEIIDKKLPDFENIKHNGYKILCEITIDFLIPELKKIKEERYWNEMLFEIEKIQNASDKIFIFSQVSEKVPNNLERIRKKIVLNITNSFELLNSYQEQVLRFESVSELIYKLDKRLFKNHSEKVFSNNSGLPTSEVYTCQKRLIDFVYKHDKKLSTDLLNLMDTDEARKGVKGALESHVEMLEVYHKLKDNKSLSQTKTEDSKTLNKALNRVYKGLLDRSIVSRKVEETNSWLECLINLPLGESYTALLAYTENLTKRLEDDPRDTILRNSLKAALANCELIQALSKRRFSNDNNNIQPQENAQSTFFKAGEHSRINQFISDWLQKNSDTQTITIIDPYFTFKQCSIFKKILEIDYNIQIVVLASPSNKSELEELSSSDWLKKRWIEISEQELPYIKFITCYYEENGRFKTPLHDRWILSDNSGMKLGSSFNQLGDKDVNLTLLSRSEANEVKMSHKEYILEKTRYKNGKRMIYNEIST
jgi:hypothetical protein